MANSFLLRLSSYGIVCLLTRALAIGNATFMLHCTISGLALIHLLFRKRNNLLHCDYCGATMKLTAQLGRRGVAQEKQASESKPIVIKKYANRRLYNTAKSSYVTLDDLAKMVRDGEDFGVFDAKSGEDITRSVLTQIIVEEEAKEQNMLPTNFLRELIRLYGDPLQGVVPSYLDATMEAFSRNQEQMRTAFASGTGFGNFEQIARANMDFFEQSMRMFSPFGSDKPKSAPSTEKPSKGDSGSGDLDAMQKQLREMQEQLEKLSKSGS
jgi:polyhydroxyalkanoate synthesis repressor PhaR